MCGGVVCVYDGGAWKCTQCAYAVVHVMTPFLLRAWGLECV